MAAKEDERGFTKAEMQVWDPRQANFQETGTILQILFLLVRCKLTL